MAVSLVEPEGFVVPPIAAKMTNLAVPLPDIVVVKLLSGMQTASNAHAAERVFVYGLSVEVTEPEESAYTKHKNLKPEKGVTLNVSVFPLVKVLLAPCVIAVPFAVTDCAPTVMYRNSDVLVAALTEVTLALNVRTKRVANSKIIPRNWLFCFFKIIFSFFPKLFLTLFF